MMKKIVSYSIWLFMGLWTLSFFTNCEETGPLIILEPTGVLISDTSYISQLMVVPSMRNVLLEEYSGVRCPNCPDGNTKSEELKDNYPGRVNVLTAHSDFLADPIGDDIDLRTEDADELATSIGGISSKPSASINRKLFSTEESIAIKNINSWEQHVINELTLTSPVNIELELISSDIMARTIELKVQLAYSESSTNHSIGIMLSESGLITDQRDGVTTIEDYEHFYVLRKAPLSVIGTTLGTETVANQIIEHLYRLDLDDYNTNRDWDMENMEITVFIRDGDGNILQSEMLEL